MPCAQALPTPGTELMHREWERGPNAAAIHRWALQLPQLDDRRRVLLQVGVSLEVGDLPLITQGGYADFRPVERDHRLVLSTAGVSDEDESQTAPDASDPSNPSAGGSAAVGAGSASGRAWTEAAGAEAGPTPRAVTLRRYHGVGEVMEEDAAPLALYFPQFSPPLWDQRLGLWFREGWLRPLRWHPAAFLVRLYYSETPHALPLLCVEPEVHPRAPHMWRQERNGRVFRSLCYTFAPDGTIMRGRGEGDDAAEVLRQGIMWLLRYLVWSEFGFWPGEDVAHDPATIERLTRPTDPCPAHTDRMYGECCRPQVLAQLRRSRAFRFGVSPTMRVA